MQVRDTVYFSRIVSAQQKLGYSCPRGKLNWGIEWTRFVFLSD